MDCSDQLQMPDLFLLSSWKTNGPLFIIFNEERILSV